MRDLNPSHFGESEGGRKKSLVLSEGIRSLLTDNDKEWVVRFDGLHLFDQDFNVPADRRIASG